jgi:Kef-type K+ transport system membrane component KefB
MTWVERTTVALIAANVLAAFSPAAVIGVISETKARGPLSELCMAIVVVADLAMVITFALTSSFARSIFPSTGAVAGVKTVLIHIGGSIGVGLLFGLMLAIYVQRVHRGAALVVFALLFIAAEAGRALNLDPLLVGLAAGLFVENISNVTGEEIVASTAPVTLPTFAIFFAVVGAEIQLRAFLHVAPFAVAAAVTRAAGIFAGARLARRASRIAPEIARLIPNGLIAQAGVAIALAVLVLNDFAPWGRVVGTVLLGSIVVNQLIGPILFRFALAKAGEIRQENENSALTVNA